MKTKTQNLLLLLSILATINVFGQGTAVYSEIQQAKATNMEFKRNPSVLKQTGKETRLLNYFTHPDEVSFFEYVPSNIVHSNAIRLSIPEATKETVLELLEVPESFYDYEVVTSDGRIYPANRQIKHYRGIVKDNSNSTVAITFCDDEVIGIIATEEGTFNIGKDKVSGKHLMFNDKNIRERPDFTCETVDHDSAFEPYDTDVLFQPSRVSQYIEADSIQQTSAAINKYVRLYFETEYDIYQTKGSLSAVEAYVTGVFNQVALLYQNEDILTKISQIYIWTTSTEPYTATTTSNLLSQFQSYRSSFTGDLGQLLTFRSIGGGQAAGFNGLCNSNSGEKLSVAMLYSSYSNVPNYSWTVYVVTHEFGHLFGSRHTHACVWNGNNTAIDGCAGFTEATSGNGYGSCSVPGYPSGGGTIMSYCHQVSSGINFSYGFGLQPGNVIRNKVINASCLLANSISGPSTICTTPATYSLSAGSASSWSVTPTSAFSLTSTYTASAVVKPLQLSGQSGTLTAIVNGVAITKTFTACSVTINGPTIICEPNTVYQLSNYSASSWSITSGFTMTTTTTSATITPTVLEGQPGTLTAIVNGVPVRKVIHVCYPYIDNDEDICAANTVYSLPDGYAIDSLWTVTPDSAFNITAEDSVSVSITPIGLSGQSGTLTATVNGIPVIKEIVACNVSISGPDTLCAANTVYSLPEGYVADTSWTIAPDSTFNIVVTAGLDSVYVTPVGLSGQAGTLMATVNGVPVTKIITACSATLSGPDTVCAANIVYSLPAGFVADAPWIIAPDSAFNITAEDSVSVSITPIGLRGQAGTLTAIVNGVEITKELVACSVTISGPDTICPAAVYTLSAGSATWSVTPSDTFQLFYAAANSVMVSKTPNSWLSGQTGTLTATVNGVTLTKAFQVCDPYIIGFDTIPVEVCAATYTLGGQPDNSSATGQWKIFDCGDNISVLTDYGDYSVFDKTTADEQPCTVATIVCALRMTLNGQNYPFFAGEKTISIPATPPLAATPAVYPWSPPTLLSPSVSPVTSGSSGTYMLKIISNGLLDSSPPPYQWTVAGPDGSIQTLYGSPASVTFSIVGTYIIHLGYNSCWPTQESSTTFTVVPTYSLYPNPVTGSILNISPISSTSLAKKPTCMLYVIRSVSTGAIVLQGQASSTSMVSGVFQINVSTLPAGLYLVQLSTCGTSILPSTLIQTSVIVIP